METEPIRLLQIPLFVYGESANEISDLYPAVWKAAESLASPNPSDRNSGLDVLAELGAHRVSPLLAYLITTCIDDPDLHIRQRVVGMLGDILTRNPGQDQVPIEVQQVVTHYLHHMSEATVLNLLEVSAMDHNSDPSIHQIFNACPYAGKYLGEILTQWKNPSVIRQKAIYFIGQVGFVDALPILERMYSRMEARQNGQYLMEFVPPSVKSDDELLPSLRIAIKQLKTH